MAQPASGAPYSDCSCRVSHRNAPGAIGAIALMVRPVKPSVALLVEDLFVVPDVLFVSVDSTFAIISAAWRFSGYGFASASCLISEEFHQARSRPPPLIPLIRMVLMVVASLFILSGAELALL